MLSIVDLRCQLPDDVPVIGREPVRLTWQVAPAIPDASQEAYLIEVSDRADFARVTFATGPTQGHEQVAVEAPGGPLWSREVRFYRVRLQVGDDWTDWSPVLRVEAGLLRPENWRAEAVTLPDDPGATAQAPAPLVRREFTLAGPVERARLYVTSLGLHEVFINGQRVGDKLLSPGWTTYRKRLLYETHDVTGLLTAGANVIAAVLGDGWYRGRIGWDPRDDRRHYGDEVGLVAQLEVELTDGSRVMIVSDGEWHASTGEIRRADLYDGCEIDLRRASGRLDPAGLRRQRLAARPRRVLGSLDRGAAHGATRSGSWRSCRRGDTSDPTARSSSTAGRTSPASSGSACEARRARARQRPPRRGPRGGRLAAHGVTALGAGHRHVRPGGRRRRRSSSRA